MTDTCLGCDEYPCICLEVHESELEIDMTYKIDVAGQELALSQAQYDDLDLAIRKHSLEGFDGWTQVGCAKITECGEKQS